MANNILFTVIEGRDVVKFPERAHVTDAGIDIYTPNDFEEITLQPNEQTLIKTGLKVIVPSSCMMLLYNKSGVSVKRQLAVGAGIVDETYTGEICVNIYNRGTEPQTIKKNEKIAQAIILPVYYHTVKMVNNEKYDKITENYDRGANGFGSTGN